MPILISFLITWQNQLVLKYQVKSWTKYRCFSASFYYSTEESHSWGVQDQWTSSHQHPTVHVHNSSPSIHGMFRLALSGKVLAPFPHQSQLWGTRCQMVASHCSELISDREETVNTTDHTWTWTFPGAGIYLIINVHTRTYLLAFSQVTPSFSQCYMYTEKWKAWYAMFYTWYLVQKRGRSNLIERGRVERTKLPRLHCVRNMYAVTIGITTIVTSNCSYIHVPQTGDNWWHGQWDPHSFINDIFLPRSQIPGSPSFQRAALKNWEWPWDKATHIQCMLK